VSAAASPLVRYGALSLAYFASVGVFNPYSPLWLQSLGVSTLAIGALASLQSWTRIVVPYAWSWLGDHSGQRVRLVQLAAAGALISTLGLLWARDLTAIAVVVALLFAFNGGVVPLSEAAVSRHLSSAPGGFDAGRYGRVRVWGSVGFIVAVLGGGWLLEVFGVQAFPVVVVAVGLALLGAALALPRSREAVVRSEPAPPVMPLLRQPVLRWFFGSVAFTVLAHVSLYAFLSLYLKELGYAKSTVGLVWALSVVFEIAFFWFQGRWFGRWSPWQWLVVVGVVTALRFALLAAAGQWVWALVLAQMSHAITFAAHHAACIALVNQHFPGRLRARGQALYTTLGYGVPGVLGGVAGGWLVEHAGFRALFAAAAAAGLAAAWCAWRGAALGKGPSDAGVDGDRAAATAPHTTL
jgi:MFS transporter, PPP family, 3-phenylpropionic acid transporter